MELDSLARQLGRSPQELERLAQSPDGQRLMQMVENVPMNDSQAAANALKQLLAQREGRALLQRLAKQLGK